MKDSKKNQQIPKKDDDLLNRAEKLLNRSNESTQNKKEKSAFDKKISVVLSEFFSKYRFASSIYKKLKSIITFPFILLKKWFSWAAYEQKDGKLLLDNKGDSKISPKRLLINSLLMIVLVFVIHVALSAFYFYTTKFSETVYVTGKQEIETGELYQFGGCTSLPCSTSSDNGKFYLIESSLYFPTLLYPEQEIFANIPLQNAACEIKGYGVYFRNFRWIYKSAQLYQHVNGVSCRPYTEEELKKTLNGGDVTYD